MLKQVVYWLFVSGLAMEGLLLGRVLGLRLYRVYAFITLDCLLSVLIDAVSFYYGWESPVTLRIFIYTRFLDAVLAPLIAWDVFEEVKVQIGKLRRLEAIRMFLSLIVIGLSAILLLVTIWLGDPNAAETWPAQVGLFIWGGSTLASLIFIWKTNRGLRKETTLIPRNTFVWVVYYLLTLASSVLFVAFEFSGIKDGGEILNVILSLFAIACTLWCVVRLRPLPIESVDVEPRA
jgi:hypothetical protein